MLDPGDADQAARALLGGVPPTTDQVGRRLTRAFPELRHPAGPPSWATVGVQLADEVVYAQSTLNLD